MASKNQKGNKGTNFIAEKRVKAKKETILVEATDKVILEIDGAREYLGKKILKHVFHYGKEYLVLSNK